LEEKKKKKVARGAGFDITGGKDSTQPNSRKRATSEKRVRGCPKGSKEAFKKT